MISYTIKSQAKWTQQKRIFMLLDLVTIVIRLKTIFRNTRTLRPYSVALGRKMRTFYVHPTLINEDSATITGSEQHHLRNVLRIELGDTIRIIDGKGSVFLAKVHRVNTESTEAQIISREFYKKETPCLTLFQGIPKHEKMELILQKTTELGVTQIIPMFTERSLQKPSDNRYERWRKVIISATKQCKRAWLPELSDTQKFEDCLNMLPTFERSLICWENEKQQRIKMVLKDIPKVESIALLVGPEGGFTDKEVNAAIKNGCIPVTINSNILRTETAAIAGITITAYEYRL